MEVEQIITIISDRLQKPFSEIWTIMVEGKRVEGILDLIIYALSFYGAYKVRQYVLKEWSGESEIKEISIFVAGISLLLLLVVGFEIEWSILRIIIPQYAVIHDIFNSLKN